MTQRYMYPFGIEELTLPAGHVLAAQSRGPMKIYRQESFSNYPNTWIEIASGSNTELSVGPFAGLTQMKLEGGAHQTIFNTGVAPRAADTLGGTDPTLNRFLYFNHFGTYAAGDWIVTQNGGSRAIADRHGGWLLLTNGTANNDYNFLQSTGEVFQFAAGRKLWFETRIETNDATASAIVAGLQIKDETPLAVSHGVFFLKAKAATGVSFNVQAAGLTTVADVATMADNVPIILGFYYDGANVMEYRVNRQRVGTTVVTNVPLTQTLTVSFGIENGAAAAKVLRMDYIRAEAEV